MQVLGFWTWHGWDALVAIGTLTLAAATGALAWFTYRVTKDSQSEIRLQRQQLETANRAYVFPWLPHNWVLGTDYWVSTVQRFALLPLKNAGPATARNVRGRVVWNLQPDVWTRSEITAGTIEPGGDENARVEPPATHDWDGGRGYIRWVDLGGQDWVTFFLFFRQGDVIAGHSHPPERISETTDPDALDYAELAARARPN